MVCRSFSFIFILTNHIYVDLTFFIGISLYELVFFIGYLSKKYLDDRNIPFTVGAQHRDELVLCRKHSCLVTHDDIAGQQMHYQADKAALLAATALVQDFSEKELEEDAKLLKKADQKLLRDDAAAKKKAAEAIRRAALTPEEVAEERKVLKEKTSTAKLAKEAKVREDVVLIEAARQRKVAVQIVNQIVF